MVNIDTLYWIAVYALALFTTLFVTFILFCAVIMLRNARDAGKLNGAPRILMLFAYATLLIGLIADIILMLLMSVLLLDLPRELLTTGKVSRLLKRRSRIDILARWQYFVSSWMCDQLSRIDHEHCGR